MERPFFNSQGDQRPPKSPDAVFLSDLLSATEDNVPRGDDADWVDAAQVSPNVELAENDNQRQVESLAGATPGLTTQGLAMLTANSPELLENFNYSEPLEHADNPVPSEGVTSPGPFSLDNEELARLYDDSSANLISSFDAQAFMTSFSPVPLNNDAGEKSLHLGKKISNSAHVRTETLAEGWVADGGARGHGLAENRGDCLADDRSGGNWLADDAASAANNFQIPGVTTVEESGSVEVGLRTEEVHATTVAEDILENEQIPIAADDLELTSAQNIAGPSKAKKRKGDPVEGDNSGKKRRTRNLTPEQRAKNKEKSQKYRDQQKELMKQLTEENAKLRKELADIKDKYNRLTIRLNDQELHNIEIQQATDEERGRVAVLQNNVRLLMMEISNRAAPAE